MLRAVNQIQSPAKRSIVHETFLHRSGHRAERVGFGQSRSFGRRCERHRLAKLDKRDELDRIEYVDERDELFVRLDLQSYRHHNFRLDKLDERNELVQRREQR